MTDLTLYGIATVPIIIGIVQAARYAGLSVHFAPILDIALGIAFGVMAQYAPPYTHPVIVQGVVIGLAAGLSAGGLYAGVSHFVSNPPAPRVKKQKAVPPAAAPAGSSTLPGLVELPASNPSAIDAPAFPPGNTPSANPSA